MSGEAGCRIYHRASKFARDGKDVSALCFDPPGPINLRRESWCLDDARTTCPKCLEIIKKRPTPIHPPPKEGGGK